jgi:hypothetical protein
MIKTVTYGAFAELVERRLANDFASSEFTVTENEIFLYLYPAIAQVITAQAAQYYAVEGIYPDLNSFNLTYKFDLSTALTKDNDSGDYYLTLPQVPVGLPEGVAIKSPTLIGSGKRSYPLIYISANTRNFALKMPTPAFGGYWYYEGSKLVIITSENLITSGKKLSVTMIASRGQNTADAMNLSDEAFSSVFDIVINKLTQRIMQPRDLQNDGVDKKTDK